MNRIANRTNSKVLHFYFVLKRGAISRDKISVSMEVGPYGDAGGNDRF